MGKSNLRSHKFNTLFLKHGFLIFVIIFTAMCMFTFLTGPAEKVNQDAMSDRIYYTLLWLACSVAFTILWLYFKERMIIVEIVGDGLLLDDGDEEELIEWSKVKSINQWFMVQPPLYRLKLHDRDNSFLFVTKPYYFSIGIFTWDRSEMGKAIKEMKQKGRF